MKYDVCNMSSCSGCCCCCWCLVAISSIPLALLVGVVLYWWLTMGFFSSLVNVSFTAGVAIVLGGLILGGVTIGGILSLIYL